MSDVDIDAAQAAVDEQAKWGETHDSRAVARVVRWARRADSRADVMQAAITDLRQRVKALEDRVPPA
jgi:hypothetical protein